MNGINFIRGNGGLDRPLPGEDHISGLIIYGTVYDTPPALITSTEELNDLGYDPSVNLAGWYHVSEYFRINPGSQLYVQGVAANDLLFTQIKTLQNFAGGKIRQLAVVDGLSVLSNLNANLAKMSEVARDLATTMMPLSVLYTPALKANDLFNLPDLHKLAHERISVVIGQDGGGLAARVGAFLPCTGAVLGSVSKARVHESIGWVERQNMVSTAYSVFNTPSQPPLGLELDVPAFVGGSLVKHFTQGQLQTIHDKGYIFLLKYPGQSGTFINDSFTATSLTNDYCYIENNRVIDKAKRAVYRTLFPKVSGPAYIDPDTGMIEPSTVAALEALCDEPLDEMVRNGALSGYKVTISPNQRLLQTSKLAVQLTLVPVGALRSIQVTIGFSVSL